MAVETREAKDKGETEDRRLDEFVEMLVRVISENRAGIRERLARWLRA